MKRFILLLFLVAIGVFLWKISHISQQPASNSSVTKKSIEVPQIPSTPSTTLFVPYWTLDGKMLPASYDTVVYFGITANMNGIDTTEVGYQDIKKFLQEVNSGQKKLLTIRLLDQQIDEKILHDTVFQQKIINDSVDIAKQYGFEGIVVDLEYKALAFDAVVKGITDFTTNFAHKAHQENLKYFPIVYGDIFYRDRPFDVAAMGKVSDGIFVMAYDFHKADGTSGANFPFEKMSDEDYSFSQMVDNFESKVSTPKLSIIFGMFGYDWTVDEKGQTIGQAESLTTNQALQKFVGRCSFKNCTINQNTAGETHATYADANNQRHVVWFEDLTSVYAKQQLLKEKGVNQTGFWAYSYF